MWEGPAEAVRMAVDCPRAEHPARTGPEKWRKQWPIGGRG
jgi:hypothetical protein